MILEELLFVPALSDKSDPDCGHATSSDTASSEIQLFGEIDVNVCTCTFRPVLLFRAISFANDQKLT